VCIKVDNVSNSIRVFATNSEHKELIKLDLARNLNLHALIHVSHSMITLHTTPVVGLLKM
jgi:hypothetical protein